MIAGIPTFGKISRKERVFQRFLLALGVGPMQQSMRVKAPLIWGLISKG
jgi:hypothetical protein